MKMDHTYKLIVFDLDGTLLDTLGDLGDAMNHALAVFGLPALPHESYRKLVGHGMTNLASESVRLSRSLQTNRPDEARVEKDTEEELSAKVLAAFKAHYALHLNDRTKPYPAMPEIVALIREKEMDIGVLSNKQQNYTEILLKQHFPQIHFRYIIGDGSLFPKKPSPASLLHMINGMGILPEQALLVGDGETDIQTAAAAGAASAGVLWGFRDKDELLAAGASLLLTKPNDLIRLLKLNSF